MRHRKRKASFRNIKGVGCTCGFQGTNKKIAAKCHCGRTACDRCTCEIHKGGKK